VIDTLGAGDTFNAAVLYYLNKSKFIPKYKEVVNDEAKNESSKNIVFREDIRQDSRIKSIKYNRPDFIDRTILQKAIEFACYIAGTKVGLRGYDGLDKISNDILQKDFLIQ
jgi:sugar/nucleoside kinase (ribokinase family)